MFGVINANMNGDVSMGQGVAHVETVQGEARVRDAAAAGAGASGSTDLGGRSVQVMSFDELDQHYFGYGGSKRAEDYVSWAVEMDPSFPYRYGIVNRDLLTEAVAKGGELIDLSWCHLSAAMLADVKEIFNQDGNRIRILKFEGALQDTSKAFDGFVDFITHAKLHCLKELDLTKLIHGGMSRLNADQVERLMGAICANESIRDLKVLKLGGNGFGTEGMEALKDAFFQGVEKFSTLEELCLAGNDMDHKGNTLAAVVISNLPELTKLSMGGNNMTDLCVTVLARLGLDHTPNLEELDLEHNQMGAQGAKELAQVLMGKPIRMLNLSKNKLDPAGAKALVTFLKMQPSVEGLPRLEALNLGCNEIGDEGLAHILPALGSIEALALYQNKLTDEGAKMLTEHATKLKRTALALTFNDGFSDEAKAELRRTFRRIQL